MSYRILPVGRQYSRGGHKVYTAVTLAWDANAGGESVTNYNLYFGSAAGTYNGAGSPIDVGNVTAYQMSLIGKPSPIYMAVKAENASGESASYSNEISYP